MTFYTALSENAAYHYFKYLFAASLVEFQRKLKGPVQESKNQTNCNGCLLNHILACV